MLVEVNCALLRRKNTMEIPVTPEKLQEWEQVCGTIRIQDFFPELNADQREFLLTGLTPEDWDEITKFEEDEE